ncbi:ABC transporter permease [Streptomyces sp. NPDC052101]|uniref:ABC transporter permease n=1 Tax=Streptomyces sp. NPDC052101 TaxID=3155763 RepID=UPI0034219794
MSAITSGGPAHAPADASPRFSSLARMRHALSDARTLTLRALLYYRHSPGLIAVSLTAPIAMFVLFGYIFGSAIKVPGGGSYRDYLMPGMFMLVGVNGLITSMTTAARDVGRGVTDRLRSMPITRSAALFGQTLADLMVSVVLLAMMVGVGLALGWRAHNGILHAMAALALILLFRFVVNWVGIFVGLLVGREDTAGQLSVLVFPFSMVTNIFVTTGGMPGWLRVIAEWNPVSAVAAASRGLFGNTVPVTGSAAPPLQHPVVATLVWCVVLLVVFVPLAVRKFTTHGR